jgi:hypothetical protein
MSSTFSHSTPGLVAGTSRTLVYGPVAAGTTVIVFDGTATNIDSTNTAQHWVTVESFDGASTYTPHIFQVPIPFGSSSKIPKITLLPGEYLYVTADLASSVALRLEYLLRT